MEQMTYTETSNKVTVYAECDILVVGGGAAGHSAAIAAARAGNKDIILMDRYGYSGGDATGGYVWMVPALSWKNKQFCRGLQEEWFVRMAKADPTSVVGPSVEEVGSTDPAIMHRWSTYGCVSRTEPKHIVRSVYFDGEVLKLEMDKMLLEHKDAIRIMYHSYVTKPIMDGNKVIGVIFESKEGRKAVYAKTVIDASGDGDIFSKTGAPFEALSESGTRGVTTTLGWRIAGVNGPAYTEWKINHPKVNADLRAGMINVGGYRNIPAGNPKPHGDAIMTNWHAKMDCTSFEDLTKTEVKTRTTIRKLLAYMKEVCPIGFKDAYLLDIAPQMGVRCGRRLVGEYVMTANDWVLARHHDDVITWQSTPCSLNDGAPAEVPYRAILPQKIDNLLCPGRHLSADSVTIDWMNLIPNCVATGQAAGIAAAVAIADGVSVRNVDIKKVQDILVDNDVPLPRHPKVDPSYMECVESNQYGLYTEYAKKAREEHTSVDTAEFRHWD